MKRVAFGFFILFSFTLHALPCYGLPAEDVRLVTDSHYFETARQLIRDSRESVRVMMFEMSYYEGRSPAPTNQLIQELIEAKKRNVRVEVILETREGEDRTTKRNRKAGKVLSEGGVEVIFDPLVKTTHAKLLIVDQSLILVGSTNWTYPALTDNHEVAVLIRSKELAKELIEYFNLVKSTGTPLSSKKNAPKPRTSH